MRREQSCSIGAAVLICVMFFASLVLSFGDDSIGGPTPNTFYYTSNTLPFLLKQSGLSSMRYQQVYNASLFRNINPSSIYVTLLKFYIYYDGHGANDWTITNIQINLSTTSRSADNLSLTFSNNVGADDTLVFGPGPLYFPGGGGGVAQVIPLPRPFRYNPTLGNLLLDVRISSGAGRFDALLPSFDAYNSPTDECSRVWAASVTSPIGDNADTLGLSTDIQMSPIPSLTAQFYPNYYPGTNVVFIRWPSQPSIFTLQQSYELGSSTVWSPFSGHVNGDPVSGGWFIIIPTGDAPPASFFRLIWPGGVGPSSSGASAGFQNGNSPAK